LFVDIAEGQLLDGILLDQFEGLQPFDAYRPDYRVLGFESDTLELFVIDGPQAQAAVVDVATSEQQIDVTQRAEIDLPGEDIAGTPTLLGDVTGDGTEDWLFTTRGDNGLIRSVVAPGSGEIVRELTEERGVLPTVTAIDRSDGGPRAVMSFALSGEQFTAELSSGSESVWRHERDFSPFGFGGFEAGYQPATPVPGIDGEGSVLIALGVVGPEGGVRVELYTPQDDLVETIPLEPFRPEFDPDEDGVIPAVRVDRIPTGDSPPLLGVTASFPGSQRSRFYLVDPAAGQKLASVTGVEPTGVALDSGTGVLGRDGSITTVSPGGVALAEPSADSTQQLEWSFDADEEYVTTVRVNQKPVTITTDQSTELRLPDGEHEIEVGARNQDGVTVYDSATAAVSEGSLADLLLYAASGLSVLLLFAFSGVKAIQRRIQG